MVLHEHLGFPKVAAENAAPGSYNESDARWA